MSNLYSLSFPPDCDVSWNGIKYGYIYRECAKQDARLKRILPTEKAESLRQPILHSIEEDEAAMIRGIPKEDVELCKQVLWQMCANRKKMCNKKDSNYKK